MKKYIKPSIEIIEIKTESLLQFTSPTTEVFPEDSDGSAIYSNEYEIPHVDVWED